MVNREEAKIQIRKTLKNIKLMASSANQIALLNKVFKDDPTILLNLNCMCDEITGIIDNNGEGTF